jgi:hypothetical protein
MQSMRIMTGNICPLRLLADRDEVIQLRVLKIVLESQHAKQGRRLMSRARILGMDMNGRKSLDRALKLNARSLGELP